MTNILELLKNEKVEWKKLGEIGSIFSGLKGVTADDFKTGTTKYIPYISVFNNYEINNDIRVETVRIKEIEKQNLVKLGDVLFTASSENIKDAGMTAVVTEDLKEETYLNSFCFIYRFFENIEILPDFSKHLFRSVELRKKISNTAQGVTRFNISKDRILNIEIPIPSLETQEKIVKILDKFTNYVTELQSELQSRTKQYTYYRDKLLSEEYLTKVTKEMEEDRRLKIFKLDEIFDFKNGLNKGKEYFGKGVPFISYVNVYKLDRLHEQDIIEKVELTQDEIARFSVEKGDVLFTRTSEVKEEVGYSSVVIEDLNNTVFNGFTIRARLKNSDLLLPEYSAHLFRCHEIRKEIIRRSSFTTRASLSGQELGKVKVVIPPLSLQNKIVKVLDKFQVLLADTKGLLPAEIEGRQKQYEYYREKLLTFDVECSRTNERTNVHNI